MMIQAIFSLIYRMLPVNASKICVGGAEYVYFLAERSLPP